MKIAIITWDIYAPMLASAVNNFPGLNLNLYSAKDLEKSPEKQEEALEVCKNSDIILLYRSTEKFWAEIEPELRKIANGSRFEVRGSKCEVQDSGLANVKKPVFICLSSDQTHWQLSNQNLEVVSKCYAYLFYGGNSNFNNLIAYLVTIALDSNAMVEEPEQYPWEGIFHPQTKMLFTKVENYLNWYQFRDKPLVGILFSRTYWVNNNHELIDYIIEKLEQAGLGCIPAFSYFVKDDNIGNKSSFEVIEDYFINSKQEARIQALIKLSPLVSAKRNNDPQTDVPQKSSELFQKLNVPVFQPVVSSYKNEKEWREDPHGLGRLTSWYVTLPEFEGVIEPIIAGASELVTNNPETPHLEPRTSNLELKKIMPIKDRCQKLVERIYQWIQLRQKPVNKRKIAFVLHNKPCASVEATVGGAAGLDSIESVAQILKALQTSGYNLNPPQDGQELITTIMNRKAVSEFRWTTVQEIVKQGGYLQLIKPADYLNWFDKQSENFKNRMLSVWGNPPGETINGVPPAMLYEGKIVVTGIQYDNAVVCVQPKRGCAGSRCDGQVCKILHDPDTLPPHQYFATYRYLEYDFKVDCIVHVGTHGNLEFLPGKGVGLSADCAPDLAIGNIPHLYIYNADNPPEGAIAKRRSLATLIDHMQTTMTKAGLSSDLEELEGFIGEYQQAKNINLARAHSLEHLIMEVLEKTNLVKDINYEHGMDFAEVIKKAHEALSLVKNSQINEGMHVFDQIPQNYERIEYIAAIFRADTDNGLSLRSTIFEIMDLEMAKALTNPGEFNATYQKSYSEILESVDNLCVYFIQEVLNSSRCEVRGSMFEVRGSGLAEFYIEKIRGILGDKVKKPEKLALIPKFVATIQEINQRLESSKEIKALLNGFDGNYIPAGPSGKITRGRYDILPSGRNFYTLDIQRLPTKAAYKVGTKLAQSALEKYLQDENCLPENIAIYWTCMDITCCDGEGMGQIMNLIGAKPVWKSNGLVNGFEIIPLTKLGRPRIDVTLRVGGINRDSFPESVAYIDEVIRAVADLDEPLELNFVRKHALEQMKTKDIRTNPKAWQQATTRIFGSKPGTYQAGVNLAVYASAWKDEQDLSDIFIYWNQYAYGKDIFGEKAAEDLVNNLKTVAITFNKAYTDEYDLFGCCCHFATQGGLTNAARTLSGKEVKAYYGDTRDMHNVGVRALADEARRIVRSKLLNPKWIEGMKKHGYKGLGDISKKIGRVYGWEATTQEVDDWIFDEITKTYVLDPQMKAAFEEQNPWALEEIGRRLLEAEKRGLWQADPETLEGLKNTYLEVESWLEEKMGDSAGEFQGSSVDILGMDDVNDWKEKMMEIHNISKRSMSKQPK